MFKKPQLGAGADWKVFKAAIVFAACMFGLLPSVSQAQNTTPAAADTAAQAPAEKLAAAPKVYPYTLNAEEMKEFLSGKSFWYPGGSGDCRGVFLHNGEVKLFCKGTDSGAWKVSQEKSSGVLIFNLQNWKMPPLMVIENPLGTFFLTEKDNPNALRKIRDIETLKQ